MVVIVSYDVNTMTKAGRRRLRKVARCCENYGQRVQFSVFECNVNEKGWIQLKHDLLACYHEKEDSLRFYHLGEDAGRRTEHFGIKPSIDYEAPLLV